MFVCMPLCGILAVCYVYRSAMVASWVSQASFEPLGLTIAVAKDRAIESMMQVHDATRGCVLALRSCLQATNWLFGVRHISVRHA